MAKQIAALANSNENDAEIMALFSARYGKQLSIIELACRQFYDSRRRWEMKRGKNLGWFRQENSESKMAEAGYNKWKDLVSSIFIQALIDHDRQTIIELADAATFFKGKLGDTFADDPVRLKLLRLKMRPMFRARSIREIAEYLNNGKKVETPADGFSALRRICKEIGLRIRPSRKIRKKKA